jgi:saccharopine dehydrogenase-like NADP-dependent oxidoreductase
MGGAVAKSLIIHANDVEVIVAGRRRDVGERCARELGPRGSYRYVDITEPRALRDALTGVDLVFHSAGPFQRGPHPAVLDAALAAGVHYLDIADDIHYARAAKERHRLAQQKKLCAMVNGGIFPGYSNIMAGELIERGGGAKRVAFDYYIAGTGGAGPTVMSSTFLLTGVPAIEYVDGRAVERRAFTGRKEVSFLRPAGKKATFYLELPEVHSCFETYGAPDVAARFGTAPEASNFATYLTGRLLPQSILSDRDKVAGLVSKCKPWLDFMDKLVGKDLAMRIDVEGNDGVQRTMQFFHRDMLEASGVAIAFQVLWMLDGKVEPGVWWPEEAITDKLDYLEQGAIGSTIELVDPSGKAAPRTKAAPEKTATPLS